MTDRSSLVSFDNDVLWRWDIAVLLNIRAGRFTSRSAQAILNLRGWLADDGETLTDSGKLAIVTYKMLQGITK